MQFREKCHEMKGELALQVWRRGMLLEASVRRNLIVNGAFTVLASLLGGLFTGNNITQIGFGINGTAPVAGNTGLTGAYMKAVDRVSYPAAGQAQFDFSLGASEDNGVAIMEFGLFTGAGVLFSRLVRPTALNKDTDISLSGSWIITL
jgi:hypothetical protein